MTLSQSAPQSQATRTPVLWRAVRRTASALKHVQDEQLLMWESFGRVGRVPAGRAGR